MKSCHALPVVLLAAFFLLPGCVERKLVIRSDPADAPVWIDEEKAPGPTPLEYEFGHYGARRIRVGPIYDKEGKKTHLERRRLMELTPPWYETFPLGFISEVLWPGTVVDRRELHFSLPPAGPGTERVQYGKERARELLEKAEEFRREAVKGQAGE